MNKNIDTASVMINKTHCEHEWWDYRPIYQPFIWERRCRLCGTYKPLIPDKETMIGAKWRPADA